MLEVLKFIFNSIVEFIKMLFTIDVGFTNLGALMCIIYIFLPVVLIIINFLKVQIIEEFDDAYDFKRRRDKYYGNSNKVKSRYIGKHEKK